MWTEPRIQKIDEDAEYAELELRAAGIIEPDEPSQWATIRYRNGVLEREGRPFNQWERLKIRQKLGLMTVTDDDTSS